MPDCQAIKQGKREQTIQTGLFMTRILVVLFIFLTSFSKPALAQDSAWIQIEAHPSLTTAEARVRSYAATLSDVNGFALGAGWYGIALGPYTEETAEELLFRYRGEGRIPRDSFIAFGTSFRDQFWPVGANFLTRPAIANDLALGTPATETETAPAATQPEPEPEPADETPREARRSESRLSRDEKKELQEMLQWAGFYNAAIDGAFGRGTRRSMSDWQDANGFEATGVLTTLQRATLKKQYNAVLEGLDLQTVTDVSSGIEMLMPLGTVAFERYESPFVHYAGTGTIEGARVILISQPGDQTTLFGLYDILQTLEAVPLDGERERKSKSFRITGTSDKIVSQTDVSLSNGAVKGFMLIWPAGDEERRTRLLSEMRASFTRLDGALDPAAGMDAEQAIDLVSGLKIRTPKLSRSGVFVTDNGLTLTSYDAVKSCTRVTIDDDYPAEIVGGDAKSGIALLRPSEPLAPAGVARFATSQPRLKSQIAIAGYPFEGVLSAPTLTFGTLEDTSGLGGEGWLLRLDAKALPGDEGGAVFDPAGAVIGLLRSSPVEGRRLPEGTQFAVSSDVLAQALSKAGFTVQSAGASAPLGTEELIVSAGNAAVLVSCWD